VAAVEASCDGGSAPVAEGEGHVGLEKVGSATVGEGGDEVVEGGYPAGWSRGGGARGGWDGESPQDPENTALRPLCCKMQHLLRLLLEPLQCAPNQHFAHADAYTTSTGDGLNVIKSLVSLFVI
jgi:hypothetical protein